MIFSIRQDGQRQGFTLIELLVSLSIITIILSISLAGVNASRMRSRDAKRVADLRTIQSALEQHAISNDSRTYPPSDSEDSKKSGYCLKYDSTGSGNNYGLYTNKCFTDYLSIVPLDPKGNQYQYLKPACFRVKGSTVTMSKPTAATCPQGSTSTTPKPYGLSVKLETGNFADAKNDETPTVATSLDIAP